MSGEREAAQKARGVAHRAVTEGVNLRYVEQLRKATYESADQIDNLAASLDLEISARVAAEARVEALRKALAAYRSALRSGEMESVHLRDVGDAALSGDSQTDSSTR